MTLEEQIDKVLISMESGKLYGMSKDTPELLRNAINKSISYNLIRPRSNTYDLTKTGYEVIEYGGFIKWKEQLNKSNNSHLNNITINAPINGVQIGQSSNFGELEFQNVEKKYPKKSVTTNQKESTFLSKIYNLTNHQVIGGIITGIILIAIAWYLNYKTNG